MKAVKSPIWILFLLTLILEIAAVVLIILTHDAICIVAYEISHGVMVFTLFMYTAIPPDLVYVIGMLFMDDLGKEPLGIMYNFIIGLCCIAGGVFLLISLTFCGNSAQTLILVAGVLGICAGLFHLINGGVSHWKLPEEESYRTPRKT